MGLNINSQYRTVQFNEDSEDINSTSTFHSIKSLTAQNKPRLTVDTTYNKEQLVEWRLEMKDAMKTLMQHPEKEFREPVKIADAQREGYKIEKWQSYPLPDSKVNFYVLIPDGVDENNPAKGGVLCIPGFGQTKELVAGEELGHYNLEKPDSVLRKAAMAKHYVDKGLVAIAVDNPSFGELSNNGHNDYLYTSRLLLEEGWSYLGLASWQDKVILDWMKKQSYLDNEKIIVSGFSLGTEPLMVLGLLDDDIYGFVYNDFLCRTRERILVMDKPGKDGVMNFPNSIEHLIPGFLLEFDFPDIVAALSPKPVICTEGGLDRDFQIIQKIYEISEFPEAFEFHHYEKYKDPSDRIMKDKTELPGKLERDEFFKLVNVDPSNHYFKLEFVMPWIDRLFLQQ